MSYDFQDLIELTKNQVRIHVKEDFIEQMIIVQAP
jgi:hypothetical protein